MASTSKLSIKCQTKSISLPCRSHPISFGIEELLNKIKTTAVEAASADTICSELSQLSRLYKCMDDLLTSSTTQVLMSREQNKNWVDELVDESVRFLDICGSISDMLSEIKGHNRELLSALRRRKGEMSFENCMEKYNCFRKKMKKDVKMLIGSLKQVDNMINGGGGGSVVVDSDNHQLVAVIRTVIGVSEVTILVFESLLMFFCVPVSKTHRWSLVVSKFLHKGIVACEDQQENGIGNEFERMDAALTRLCKYGVSSEMRNVQIAQCRLDRLGAQIECMEGGLDSIFRCLVRTRVSLLNIISQ
ncbi:hypothetical protein HanRHA438_Chr07g0305051 [Helianthus annuus]|uniref:DUF241 domain protein n=1 Tax=Helianthus annuus TaxID=4232 RepID=A0A251UBV4_HELAN|nr:uncharacterized protein LOC110866320 [Helianthus annuus]KAF5798605.1 hypothetical protein HanXRQr2_Chr07g0294861 [Helianthus annuus]KAJ0550183.1 hypothetical protein HanHA300_Chr07g0242491 [Helianthus annuus]KAJ0563139.1 hypothetical protein HanHA89_Chr07g0259701 [Helianthus annuus]KAJ0728506.1 hypothetical protein HanLR1_Chr07g0242381 [Helianthus annuus]KAJ0731257.1 hypothetical protein HanOQP8_Chr07g0249881 [Helianthus annuus]